jgi:hypothetical protein
MGITIFPAGMPETLSDLSDLLSMKTVLLWDQDHVADHTIFRAKMQGEAPVCSCDGFTPASLICQVLTE